MKPSKAVFQIQDRETLKAVIDPLRTQIFEILIAQPLTIKQVADKLGLTPSNLYYHFNLLEKFGLIQVVETRQVANLVERLYQSTAADISIAPDLVSSETLEGQDSIRATIASTIDATRDDLLRSMHARFTQLERGAPRQERSVILSRSLANIPTARLEEFLDRIQQLTADFEAAEIPAASQPSRPYALTVVFYPSFYLDDQVEAAEPAQE
jgi:DNA-binding transcriptional ArsR family regulator